jgi:hypothetical protein
MAQILGATKMGIYYFTSSMGNTTMHRALYFLVVP